MSALTECRFEYAGDPRLSIQLFKNPTSLLIENGRIGPRCEQFLNHGVMATYSGTHKGSSPQSVSSVDIPPIQTWKSSRENVIELDIFMHRNAYVYELYIHGLLNAHAAAQRFIHPVEVLSEKRHMVNWLT
jgi:hypothetical protein